MQKIYGLLSDNGDGSASINWFKSYELCEKLMEEDPERWSMNEGSPCEILTFPDELNLDKCGFVFSDDEYEE